MTKKNANCFVIAIQQCRTPISCCVLNAASNQPVYCRDGGNSLGKAAIYEMLLPASQAFAIECVVF